MQQVVYILLDSELHVCAEKILHHAIRAVHYETAHRLGGN